MKGSIGVMALALVLGACGSRNESEGQSITVGSGSETATVRVDSGDNGIAPPENLPAFAPIYPGATIQSAITGREGETKGMVAMMTGDPVARVISFYKDKGKAAGMTVAAEAAMGDVRMLTLSRPGTDGSDPAVQVSVAPAGEGGKALVTLVYDGGTPA